MSDKGFRSTLRVLVRLTIKIQHSGAPNFPNFAGPYGPGTRPHCPLMNSSSQPSSWTLPQRPSKSTHWNSVPSKPASGSDRSMSSRFSHVRHASPRSQTSLSLMTMSKYV